MLTSKDNPNYFQARTTSKVGNKLNDFNLSPNLQVSEELSPLALGPDQNLTMDQSLN